LQSLAGTADLLARRDFDADERQAFMLATDLHALVDALDAALTRSDASWQPHYAALRSVVSPRAPR
jgi:hypothetical protein